MNLKHVRSTASTFVPSVLCCSSTFVAEKKAPLVSRKEENHFTMKRYATALLLSSRSFHVYGFTAPSTLVVRPKQTSFLHAQSDDASSKDSSETIFYNDFEDYAPPSTTSGELNFSDLFQERVKELKQDERRLLKNWRSGRAKSYGAFTINERYLKEKDAELPFDWVRRVDIGEYPRVACGSAHGENPQ
jgi:hypothetical protein